MHELSIVMSLFETLEEKAKANSAKRITAVKLKIGKFSGVVPELLESAFDMYKKDTIASDARLEVESIPLRIRCRKCRIAEAVEEPVFVCSRCGSTDLEILAGREMLLEKLELEI